MRIQVRVITGASLNKEQKMEDGVVKVWLTQRPHDGQANEALVEFLAERFNVAKSRVKIVKGLSSINKIVEIL
jgi:uncharacterized protein YggU (UPF0235/DUF167 family)